MLKMFKYIFPIWCSMIINTLLSLTDMIFLRTIDISFIASIGIAIIPFSFISIIFTGIAIETNRSIASNKNFDLKNMAIKITFVSLIIALLSRVGSSLIFTFAQNNSASENAIEYFNIYIFSLIPISTIYICTGVLRGLNEAKVTIKFSCLAVILNILFDYIFIIYLRGFNPLKGCALASVLSDAITAIVYFIYVSINYTQELNNSERINQTHLSFFKNCLAYLIEKLFSTSSLQILSQFFIVLLPVATTSIYYGFNEIFASVSMLSHSYFEWIIYSKSKGITNNTKQNYMVFIGIILLFNIISYIYLGVTSNYIPFMIIYAIYYILIFAERENVAILFANEKATTANKIIFIKSISILICLQVLLTIDLLNLFTIILTQVIIMSISTFLMQYLKHL